MPRLFIAFIAALSLAGVVRPADDARFTAPLPDPLRTPDGNQITSAQQWTNEQRPRILELFQREVYGRAPVGRPADLTFTVVKETSGLFAGSARRKIVRISYTGPGGAGQFDVTIYLPATAAPRGTFVLIDNRSRDIIDQADTKTSEFWPV